MSILGRVKRLFGKKNNDDAAFRAVRGPVRVQVADQERSGTYFTRIEDWDTFYTAPPSWEIPSVASQWLWVDGLIASHHESGSLDGLVPDLLDRLITYRMDDLRSEIEEAHLGAQRTQQRLYEQAKVAQAALNEELKALRNAEAEAQRGYDRAYEFLTWEKPVRDSAPSVVAPTLIRTQIAVADANDAPTSWPEPFPLPHQHAPAAVETDPDNNPTEYAV